MNLALLEKELDKTKISIFLGSTAALLGNIMCSFEIVFDSRPKTAQIGKRVIRWNPDWFTACTAKGRIFTLLHELWHIARLHRVRRGTRTHKRWNIACDYVINEGLAKEGYACGSDDLGGIDICLDKQYYGMTEEQIYELLPPDEDEEGDSTNSMDDMPPSDEPDEEPSDVPIVVRAIEAANQAGSPGGLPIEVVKFIAAYLNPVVPWQNLLNKFFNDLAETRHTWKRPSRRYTTMYLPSRYKDEGKLAKLNYYLDISGSVTQKDILRFNSEFDYVKRTYAPKEMVQILFNTHIIKRTVIKDSDLFTDSIIRTGGGTSLYHVREDIIESKPTAAIIFTDLECSPMATLPFSVPIIWVIVGKVKNPVPFGVPVYIDL
jgi:predicted metal-dependent peptidase